MDHQCVEENQCPEGAKKMGVQQNLAEQILAADPTSADAVRLHHLVVAAVVGFQTHCCQDAVPVDAVLVDAEFQKDCFQGEELRVVE